MKRSSKKLRLLRQLRRLSSRVVIYVLMLVILNTKRSQVAKVDLVGFDWRQPSLQRPREIVYEDIKKSAAIE